MSIDLTKYNGKLAINTTYDFNLTIGSYRKSSYDDTGSTITPTTLSQNKTVLSCKISEALAKDLKEKNSGLSHIDTNAFDITIEITDSKNGKTSGTVSMGSSSHKCTFKEETDGSLKITIDAFLSIRVLLESKSLDFHATPSTILSVVY